VKLDILGIPYCIYQWLKIYLNTSRTNNWDKLPASTVFILIAAASIAERETLLVALCQKVSSALRQAASIAERETLLVALC
jgi:hypothetical protein